MKITVEKFPEVSEEIHRKRIEEFTKFIKQVSKDFDLYLLDEIIVPIDFGIAVTEFQTTKGLPVGFTNNERSVTEGKTLEYEENGKIRVKVFYQPHLYFDLFKQDQSNHTINTFQHELAHAHDFGQKLKMADFTNELQCDNKSALERALLVHSTSYWDEYIASRLSVATLRGDDLSVMQLIDLIKQTEPLIHESIERFIENTDGQALLGDIESLTIQVMNVAAHVLGNVHGLGYQNTKISEVITENINQTFLGTIWQDFEFSLLDLHKMYPEWNGLSCFNGLNAVVKALWKTCGIEVMDYPGDTVQFKIKDPEFPAL